MEKKTTTLHPLKILFCTFISCWEYKSDKDTQKRKIANVSVWRRTYMQSER